MPITCFGQNQAGKQGGIQSIHNKALSPLKRKQKKRYVPSLCSKHWTERKDRMKWKACVNTKIKQTAQLSFVHLSRKGQLDLGNLQQYIHQLSSAHRTGFHALKLCPRTKHRVLFLILYIQIYWKIRNNFRKIHCKRCFLLSDSPDSLPVVSRWFMSPTLTQHHVRIVPFEKIRLRACESRVLWTACAIQTKMVWTVWISAIAQKEKTGFYSDNFCLNLWKTSQFFSKHDFQTL